MGFPSGRTSPCKIIGVGVRIEYSELSCREEISDGPAYVWFETGKTKPEGTFLLERNLVEAGFPNFWATDPILPSLSCETHDHKILFGTSALKVQQ
jgi:hypothetical protein